MIKKAVQDKMVSIYFTKEMLVRIDKVVKKRAQRRNEFLKEIIREAVETEEIKGLH